MTDATPAVSKLSSFPAKSGGRYQSLDLWRGLACVMLVMFHANMQAMLAPLAEGDGRLESTGYWSTAMLSRTWIGVPIFFVISGFCIMATIDSRRRRKEGIGKYFVRRFWRIYPPYWVAIGLSVAVIAALEYGPLPGIFSDGIFTVPQPGQMSGWQWFGNLTLTESWRHLVAGGATSHVLPNTWTLCYEEQFYFVAGMMLFFAPNRLFTAAWLLTGVSIATKAASKVFGFDVHGSFFDGRWLIIALGILVYYRINYASKWQRRAIEALLLVGLLVSAASPRTLAELLPNHTTERFVAFGFALLICLLHQFDARIAALWLLIPFKHFGKMSYSIYLIHPLVTKGISHGLFRAGWQSYWFTSLVVVPTCLITSLAAAWCFYRLFEHRFANPPSEPKAPKPAIEPAENFTLVQMPAEPVGAL